MTSKTIAANELRIGNWINDGFGLPKRVAYIGDTIGLFNEVGGTDKYQNNPIFSGDINNLHPIELTPEILEKAGFYQLPHFTVNNGWHLNIGRDRVITVACVGTPNEMIFLCEEDKPKVKNINVLKNFDYDGKVYVHQLQNLIHSITGEELTISLT